MAGRMTAPRISGLKGKRPVVMITAYDATFARLMDLADVDVVLVGDSLGNVIQGHDTTIPVDLDDVIYHTRCVSRGLEKAHLVADMPFMSYQVSDNKAMKAAGRLLKEGRAQSVKLEGGRRVAQLIRRMVDAGIPVMGHVGLTPQSVHQFGGYKLQGRKDVAAEVLLDDARAVVDAGAYSLVLEGMPGDLAAEITAAVSVPTIGISAGPGCDGQVLVIYDLLGMDERFSPRFLKKYADLSTTIVDAVRAFGDDVKAGTFPGPEHFVNRKK
ncbi:MAG: 3-methyl-2-oxobutanoate hydroxymethyltransferase [Pseudomonadota bacterium]